ncbi:MAG: hypothetical protein JSU01_20800 [Bacteroidetes bacterium]|nr:hypothetical protein [Bacteroidota bacterium]
MLVRPDLTIDPANKKNEVGVIRSADLRHDNFVVRFSDGSEGLFSSDALLVLRDTNEIRRDADYDETLLFREDYFDIMEACFLAESCGLSGLRAAVELSQKCPMALEYTMRPLNDELSLDQSKSIRR